jgi:hypothetical protein
VKSFLSSFYQRVENIKLKKLPKKRHSNQKVGLNLVCGLEAPLSPLGESKKFKPIRLKTNSGQLCNSKLF